MRSSGRNTTIVSQKPDHSEQADSRAAEALRERIEHEYAEGDILFDIGDEPEVVFFLRTGQVEVHAARGRDETPYLAGRFGPGDCLGARDWLNSAPRGTRAQALCATRVLEIDGETFGTMCRERADLAWQLLRAESRRAHRLERRLAGFGVADLIRPIAFALLSRGEPADPGLRIPTTLRGLANDTGLTLRETHCGLQELFESKSVKLHDDVLWVPDPEALGLCLAGSPLADALPQ